MNMVFDYDKEPSRDILCIDCKSFYASCEAVARGLNPLKTKLVVMSYPSDSVRERGSGLILASSPMAKKAYGISNVSRARDLPFPYPEDLVIAPPRMNLYMTVHRQINEIFRCYVDDQNVATYSVDETFLDVTDSLSYFNCKTAYELAKIIQIHVYKDTGIYTTVGIGDNPLLAKLALDNEAKHTRDMKAEWRYEDVVSKLWKIETITDFWGIGSRTALRLKRMGIDTIEQLAHANYHHLKKEMGVIGMQLYAHAWGIDRTFLGEHYIPKSKSIGNSQVLNRDYTNKQEIIVVIREMADQVATRLRKENKYTKCIGLWIGYSLSYIDETGKTGFSKQVKIEATNNSARIAEALLQIFDQYYDVQVVRNLGINCTQLENPTQDQLSLFEPLEIKDRDRKLDQVVDDVRSKFGFTKLVYASSLTQGGRAIARSSLVGGHAGGMEGIESRGSEDDTEADKKNIYKL
ncbi:Y-family DNA polymerase [Erysipelothrix amsterdamensis]|uniref:Y-family DNA polymerase n=1 Tax=Erysipelothrix amsterdamensis TaxID=2929157 RepID=A0AAU9VKE8_9FIRM|nr:Y-family DNA polymerase [Erysipelothrix rhusiopathiae]CAH2762193.1 Y-family DNA polymerase [Erysipelothrix sp. A18Y020d]AGN23935.1 UmuC-like DNA-repair protein [Erysipelothrix rhusiopathiae SY1027]AMS11272.1 excinuclease ABC subunit A [Erysipelothrix rhusiopathiae]AOO67770.1 excinuclease ABC subunit A [Erysipelothrix rhusiopathiae]AWU41372.1 excinuclease ABC subunit A [Erysipelothrix rhusiopathiae]